MKLRAEAEKFKADITLHYLNARLQRAKTMPKLDSLTRERKKTSFREAVERIRAAPKAESMDG